MKTIVLVLGIVIVLGIGALWLYAAPQSAPPAPPTLAQSADSSSPSQQQPASSTPATGSPAALLPLAITHTVGTAAATPTVIATGTSTQVTVTILITDQALIPNSVNLLRLGASGTQSTILGVMQSAGNGAYSLQHSFNEPAAGQIQLQVSAAFQGALQRILSNVVIVSVQNTPKITWSVPQLSQTMFPGTTSTVTVSFRSDQNLTGVAVDITPSLSSIVSASPASFASITVNQPYQITFTFTAPPQFIKRSFGGTVHIRNAGIPTGTYDTPLTVNLETDFLAFTDPQFLINVPAGWTPSSTITPAGGSPTDPIRFVAFSLPTDPDPVLYILVYPHGFDIADQADEPPGFLGTNNLVDFYFTMRNAPADPQLLPPGVTPDLLESELLTVIKTFKTQ
jgi:hypothetical protein